MNLPGILVLLAAAGSHENPKAAAIDSAVRAQADSGFTGVVLVAHKGRIVLKRAYGSSQMRVDTSTAFWIGSITKEFTAGVILELSKRGLLSLTDTIGRFIPNAPADKKPITIRQLLTHTDGIDAKYAGFGIVDRDSAVKVILAQPLYARPGTAYRYNDDDYELLAAIAEIVSGMKWERLVSDLLIKPAGLHRTGFWNGTAADWGHKGANGMSSTAGDLLRWMHALRNGSVLNAREVRAIEGPQVFVRRERDEEVYYGFGTRVYQCGGRTTEVFHSGSSDDGNTAVVRVLANGITIIVLTNAGQHAGTTWSSYVAQHLPAKRLNCAPGGLS
jgi:CubicO group peptidase (beta-lactamase class C family)